MASGSFQTITIHRAIPIIAGYLQIPPNREKNKTSIGLDDLVTSPPVGSVVRLGDSGGASTAGSKHGTQELYVLDGVAIDAIDTGYNTVKNLV